MKFTNETVRAYVEKKFEGRKIAHIAPFATSFLGRTGGPESDQPVATVYFVGGVTVHIPETPFPTKEVQAFFATLANE